MQQSRTRRLIAAAFIVGAIAALSIWFGRQLHQQLLNRALIAAIKKSDAAGVDTILAAGADPNTRDSPEKQESLLERVKHLFRPAATLEPTALILALQQRGPIREPGDEHPMPMQLLAIVKSLVARGADVSARDSHGDTPIGELYTYDHPGSQDLPRILETLLTAGESANPILNEPGALSPLYCAVAINDTLSVHLLLDHGANTEATDFHGSTPLMIACREDDRTGIVRMLLDHRANLNTTDHLGNTPLMEAAIYGRTANARLPSARDIPKLQRC